MLTLIENGEVLGMASGLGLIQDAGDPSQARGGDETEEERPRRGAHMLHP
jgi:hypothetical protein